MSQVAVCFSSEPFRMNVGVPAKSGYWVVASVEPWINLSICAWFVRHCALFDEGMPCWAAH